MPYIKFRKPKLVKSLDGTRDIPLPGQYETGEKWVPPQDRREKELVRHGRVLAGLTALCLALSVVAIGGLFTRLIHSYGYAAGGVFDAFWLYALYTEHLADLKHRVRIVAQAAGLAFMAAAATAIILDGYRLHVAVLGYLLAIFPLGMKGFWWMRFGLVKPHLSREQEAQLEDALGDVAVRTRVAETKILEDARLSRLTELLDAAADRSETVTAEQITRTEADALVALDAEVARRQEIEQQAQAAAEDLTALLESETDARRIAEQQTERLAVVARKQSKKIRKLKRLSAVQPSTQPAQLPLSPVEPIGQHQLSLAQRVPPQRGPAQLAQPPYGQHVEPPAQPFGFVAQPSAQVAERLSRVAQAAELLAAEPGLSSAQLAERLGVSLASAKRYLSDARKTI
jgi:hypothetical protein